MSDVSLGHGWWLAADGRYYAPDVNPLMIGANGPRDPSLFEKGRFIGAAAVGTPHAEPVAETPLETDSSFSQEDFYAEDLELVETALDDTASNDAAPDPVDTDTTPHPTAREEVALDPIDVDTASNDAEPDPVDTDTTPHPTAPEEVALDPIDDDTASNDAAPDPVDTDTTPHPTAREEVAPDPIDVDTASNDAEPDPVDTDTTPHPTAPEEVALDPIDVDTASNDAAPDPVDTDTTPHPTAADTALGLVASNPALDPTAREEVASSPGPRPTAVDIAVVQTDSDDGNEAPPIEVQVGEQATAREEHDDPPATPTSPDDAESTDPRRPYRDAISVVSAQIQRGHEAVLEAYQRQRKAPADERDQYRHQTLDALERLNRIADHTPDVDRTEARLADALGVAVHRAPHVPWSLNDVLDRTPEELSRRLFSLRWESEPEPVRLTHSAGPFDQITADHNAIEPTDADRKGLLPVWGWAAAFFLIAMVIAQLVSSGGDDPQARPQVAGVAQTPTSVETTTAEIEAEAEPTATSMPTASTTFRLELPEAEVEAANQPAEPTATTVPPLTESELIDLAVIGLSDLRLEYGLSIEEISERLTATSPPLTISRSTYDNISSQASAGTDQAASDLFRSAICELIARGATEDAITEALAETLIFDRPNMMGIVELTQTAC